MREEGKHESPHVVGSQMVVGSAPDIVPGVTVGLSPHGEEAGRVGAACSVELHAGGTCKQQNEEEGKE